MPMDIKTAPWVQTAEDKGVTEMMTPPVHRK